MYEYYYRLQINWVFLTKKIHTHTLRADVCTVTDNLSHSLCTGLYNCTKEYSLHSRQNSACVLQNAGLAYFSALTMEALRPSELLDYIASHPRSQYRQSGENIKSFNLMSILCFWRLHSDTVVTAFTLACFCNCADRMMTQQYRRQS
jgi:hypothetical protein